MAMNASAGRSSRPWSTWCGKAPLAASFDDEVMTLWLGRDRRVDSGVKQMVGFACSERRSKIGGILLAEAHIESAGAGHPYPIARLTEIVGERRDETKEFCPRSPAPARSERDHRSDAGSPRR